MEIDIDVYFWMVDRGLFDDDQRNKVDMERNKVKLHREHSQRFENAFYIGKIMLLLKKSIMKIQKKPFTLDPGIQNMKDQITSTVKQANWAVTCKELKKFGIKIDAEKKAKIIEGRTQLINEILSKLFDFDNGGLQSGRFQDGNLSEILNTNNMDTSMINNINSGALLDTSQINNDPTSVTISIDGNNSVLIPTSKQVSMVQNNNQNSPSLPNSEKLSKQTTMNNSPIKRNKNLGISASVTSLNDINEQKDLAFSETTLEFILLSLSKSLQIKPKQAAGLLSNNHKFLMHIAIKGMKGNDYSKIQQWYLDIYQNTTLLIQLIDNEKDQNAMKLTLNIIKCGLYSQNMDLAIYCGRLLSKIGQEINQIGGQLCGLAWDWLITPQVNNSSNMPQSLNDVQVPNFNNTQQAAETQTFPSNESGLQSIVFCYKRFLSEGGLIEHIFPLLVHYGKNNPMELFNHHLKQQFIQDKFQYLQLFHEILINHASTVLFKDTILNTGIFIEWLNAALRMAEQDGANTVIERVGALTYLADVWELQSDSLESGANGGSDTAQAILSVLKRGCRDRIRIIRVQSFELLFRLLTIFATNRNQFAPIIYKSLTFLLIEFHQDGETREHLMKHFINLFQQIQTVPVAILCEPLIKQIEISQSGINMLQIALTQNPNPSYQFNIFDFEFFSVVVHHKRVNLQTAMQVVDLQINIATSNIFFANTSISIILEVLHKFSREPLLHTQFSQITKQQITLLEDSERFKQKLEQQRKKQKELQQKKLEETLKLNKTNKYVQNKIVSEDIQKKNDIDQEIEAQSLARQTKERLVVNLLKQILMFGNDMIKQNMRNQLLGAFSRIDKILKVKSASIKYLLQLYGEDIPKMLQYFVENEQESSTNTEKLDQQLATLDNSTLDPIQNQLVLADINSSSSPSKKIGQKAALHLERVLRDIEKVKNNLANKQESRALQEELKRAKDEKLKSISKKQVDNMKLFEHGVAPKEVRNFSQDYTQTKKLNKDQLNGLIGGDDQLQIKIIKAKDLDISEIALEENEENSRMLVPFDKNSQNKKSQQQQNTALKKLKQFQLYDLRMEEQKDQDAVRFFVKKNMKIFRNLFNRYANTSGPLTQVNQTFDSLQQKNSLITVAELLKMMKEFQISNLSCSKDDVINMVRLINLEIIKKKDKGQASLSVLEFEGFIEFMLQLAVHLYNFDAQMSPAEYLQRLFDHFKQISQKINSNNAKLFEDPGQYTVGDQKLLQELNKRVLNDPNYKLPDGFQKIVEKEVVNNYSIPAFFPISESKRVVIEVLDSYLNELFGFHFLEPMSEIKEMVKVKPNLKQVARDKVMHEIHSTPINPKSTYAMSTIKPGGRDRSRQGAKHLSSSIDVNPIRNQRASYSTNSNKSLLNLKSAVNKSLFKSPRLSMGCNEKHQMLKPQLGVELKLEVAKAPQQNRQHVLDTAYVLEEILHSVENGLDKLPPPGFQIMQKAKIMNRVLEEKMKKQENDEQQKQLDKQKLEMRKKILNDQLKKIKLEKESKQKEEAEKKKAIEEQEKGRQESKDRRKKEIEGTLAQKQKEREEQEEKRKRKQEERKRKLEEEIAQQMVANKPKRRNDSVKNKVQGSLLDRSRAMIENKKRAADGQGSSEVQQITQMQNQLKQNIQEKAQEMAKKAAKNQQERQNKEQKREEYNQFVDSQDVKDLFNLYDKALLAQFETSCKFDSTDTKNLSYNSFLKFGNKSTIIPTLITSQDYQFVYKTLLRGKNNDDQEGSKLNYQQFKEALIRIAILAKLKLQQDGVEQQQQQQKNSKQSVLEKEFDVTDMNTQVIENLFRHIGLKLDKSLQKSVSKSLIDNSRVIGGIIKKTVPPGLDKRIQELQQQKQEQQVNQSPKNDQDLKQDDQQNILNDDNLE